MPLLSLSNADTSAVLVRTSKIFAKLIVIGFFTCSAKAEWDFDLDPSQNGKPDRCI
jgi:hypothetical protein